MAMRPLLVLVLLTTGGIARAGADADPAAIEFFEKEVRPLLASRCQKCHGAEKQKGGLRLDSRATALAGGANGPAIVPGKPAESPLIDAINYGDLVQMPPRSRLPAAEIATLTKWVELGAPWPEREPAQRQAAGRPFDLKERSQHWSFRPIRAVDAPAVRRADWPRTPIDRFLLAELEAKGLAPAGDADRRTLIRRATFDLIGLPPSPEDVEAFLADESPEAFDKVVERLVASPQYGERWARHWLDLVRYAETAGHEFDYDILGADRYRDYVIRAFNADVPYDQFVIEHVAGDLLERPRRHPTEGTNESILGTGSFALGEGTHSPVDVREEQVRRIDNQIDVLSKTFLGLTVACARCHDHKFDAISTRDYYALAGYLRSSRHQQAFLDPPERIGAKVAELERIKAQMVSPSAAPPPFRGLGAQVAAGLRATITAPDPAAGTAIDPALLDRWTKAVQDPSARAPGHPLHAWAAFAGLSGDAFATRRREVIAGLKARASAPEPTELFEDFDSGTYKDWSVSGDAFGPAPTRPGDVRVGPGGLLPVPPGLAHSGLVADRLRGVLRSRTFAIRHKLLHVRAAGRGGRINLVVDGFEKIRDPIYGRLTVAVDAGDTPRWYTLDVAMWAGHDAYIEIGDGATTDFTGATVAYAPGDGSIAVDEIRFSDGAPPPSPAGRFALDILDSPEVDSLDALAGRLGRAVDAIAEPGRADADGREAERYAVLGWLSERGLIRPEPPPGALLARYREIEAQIPPPTLAPALIDGTGVDERVQVRGNYRTSGDVVPRRFLEAIAGADQPAPAAGSGRLELARRMVAPSNPLTARVLVNRLWQHHFGRGLVATPDDFGAMGQPPSHPLLLDYLAHQFVAQGWSIKRMHRLMVLSRAYQMRSVGDAEADQADPDNRLLHRMNVRRLEAEAVRDAILAASGRLNRTPFGPSVPTYLTPFMDGRGRPAASGPLDGLGRRSLYLGIRRNFLNPMLLAFDFPAPATTMGRRNVSNVPAQALTLLNDPFVVAQARHWADRILAEGNPSPDARLARLYQTAFARPPSDSERAEARTFLDEQSRLYGQPDDPHAWADLCHVLFNTKEFIYLK